MKNVLFRKVIVPAVILTFIALAMSSCQRGYGCPYKMSANTEVRK